jgi:hypothetical protein
MFSLNSTLGQLLLVLGFAVLVFVGMMITVEDPTPMTTRFFDGTLTGGNTQVFYQDPRIKKSKTVHRSVNEKGGIELTYDWWMMVNQFPNNGQSVVFIKGDPGYNSKSNKVYSPAVVLQNKDGNNEMNVMFNTYATEDEIVVIKNMPISTWVHCAIVVKNKAVYVYVNGKLARSQKIAGIIRQNYGNLVVGPNRGFSGMISDLTYNRRALNPAEIANIAAGSPNKKIIGVSNDLPPYISKSWYMGGGNVDYIST